MVVLDGGYAGEQVVVVVVVEVELTKSPQHHSTGKPSPLGHVYPAGSAFSSLILATKKPLRRTWADYQSKPSIVLGAAVSGKGLVCVCVCVCDPLQDCVCEHHTVCFSLSNEALWLITGHWHHQQQPRGPRQAVSPSTRQTLLGASSRACRVPLAMHGAPLRLTRA